MVVENEGCFLALYVYNDHSVKQCKDRLRNRQLYCTMSDKCEIMQMQCFKSLWYNYPRLSYNFIGLMSMSMPSTAASFLRIISKRSNSLSNIKLVGVFWN